MEQKEKEIKDMTKIKANKIGVDLTKNFLDVMKEEKKKVKNSEDGKKPLTEVEKGINARLHPASNNDEERIKKLQEKKKKMDEMDKEMN